MQKVLIPVNEADFSLHILPSVRRFLNPKDTLLILLHVDKKPQGIKVERPGMEDVVIYADQQEASLRIEFKDASLPTVRKLEAEGFQVTTDVIFGKPAETIEQFIESQDIDLVAMATHGRTGMERVLYGSVAEHVLRHTSTPILLFHPELEKEKADKSVMLI